MFNKILIANRGEIALRVIRACREMGIDTVAVYSTADKDSLPVLFATESVCIGSPAAADSYLDMRNVLEAAVQTGCDAIHPGFGFLSENAEFARLAQSCGIQWIGPSPEVIDKMGNKSAARELMTASGVPVVPGSDGDVKTVEDALSVAERIGYPVLAKAAAGGGGRGMRQIFSPEELPDAFMAAKNEAQACFGDDQMYLEKLVINPKHIEFQIMADTHGNIIHLCERDCSIQRRNQKMIEEAPCRELTPKLRAEMGAVAIRAAQAANYTNAGTIEFVMDAEGNYYFIEMNTRIQVEHPVTEMLTNVDLVREQIRVAAGLPLSVTQEQIIPRGHVIECRINAEDPTAGFRPSPGDITFMHMPGGNGVRIDSALYTGCRVSPYYDSMLAKVIVWAPTRLEAIRKMRRALEELIIEGVETNCLLAHLIMYVPEFIKGTYNTGFIPSHLDELLKFYEDAESLESEKEV